MLRRTRDYALYPSMDPGNGAYAWFFFEAPVAPTSPARWGPVSSWRPCPDGEAPVAKAEEIPERTVESDEEALRCLAERKELMHLRERAR